VYERGLALAALADALDRRGEVQAAASARAEAGRVWSRLGIEAR
jgi:hypothetical protein